MLFSKGRIKINKNKINKILVIVLGGLGDCVISTAFVRELKKNVASAEIDILLRKGLRGVYFNNPNVGKIIEYDKRLLYAFLFLNKIKKFGYDLVIDLYGNPRSALITLFSNATYRVGFSYRLRKYAYNIRIKPDRSVRCDEYVLNLLKSIGFKVEDSNFELFPTQEDINFVKRLMKDVDIDRKLVIGINPGAGFMSKRWEYYPELINKIKKTYNAFIILIQGPNDEYAENIITKITTNNTNNILIASYLTPTQLFYLFNYYTHILISNDSGVKYIASAAFVTTLTIFGPTDPITATPARYINNSFYISSKSFKSFKKLSCIPCGKTYCSHKTCLQLITPDDVLLYLKNIINVIDYRQ